MTTEQKKNDAYCLDCVRKETTCLQCNDCSKNHHEGFEFKETPGKKKTKITIPKDFPEYDKKEMVDKPDHYGGTLTIDYIEALEKLPGNKMNFSRTSSIKYLSRAGMKDQDKEIQDLEKVIWYMKREIERLQK